MAFYMKQSLSCILIVKKYYKYDLNNNTGNAYKPCKQSIIYTREKFNVGNMVSLDS